MRINGINSSTRMHKIYKKTKENRLVSDKETLNIGDKIKISDIAREIVRIDNPIIDESKKIERIISLIKDRKYDVDSKKLAISMIKGIKKWED